MLRHRNQQRWREVLATIFVLLLFGRVAPAQQDRIQADASVSIRQVALGEAFRHVVEVWHDSTGGSPTTTGTPGCSAEVWEALDSLARAGCVEAARTCLLDYRRLRGLPAEGALSSSALEHRMGLYEYLVQAMDSAQMELALDLLRREQELSSVQIEGLVRRLARRRRAPLGVQAQAKLDLARLLGAWSSGGTDRGVGRAARLAEALTLYKSIRSEFEGTEFAGRAGSAVWRLEHLSPGKVAPDFLAHDPAGNEIRLSDFRGQAVVVHISDPTSADFGADLDRAEAEGRRHWDSRFAWVGIHRGGSSAALEEALGGTLPCGEHAWEGAGASGAAEAWRIPAYETIVVIGPSGLVFAVNPAKALLDRHITDLLSELVQQGRQRQADSGGGSNQGGGGDERGTDDTSVGRLPGMKGGASGEGVRPPGDQTP
ncbi:MAG TPA: hypothetical protein QF446_06895 [Planctomycetota bacterium]|nr:hypothetical protein [Planctomycetota bacterium]